MRQIPALQKLARFYTKGFFQCVRRQLIIASKGRWQDLHVMKMVRFLTGVSLIYIEEEVGCLQNTIAPTTIQPLQRPHQIFQGTHQTRGTVRMYTALFRNCKGLPQFPGRLSSTSPLQLQLLCQTARPRQSLPEDSYGFLRSCQAGGQVLDAFESSGQPHHLKGSHMEISKETSPPGTSHVSGR